MTRLPIKAGGGDVADAIVSARWEKDEVAGKNLVLPHHDDVADLKEKDTRDTSSDNIEADIQWLDKN